MSLGLTNQTAFTFKLGYGDSLLEKVGDVELSSYAVQETKDDQVVYYLRLPQKGDYYLIVFANLVPDDPDTAEGMYKAICEYKVVCDEPAKADPVAFPSCSDVSWGPDAFVTQYGLTPKNREAILMAPNGHVEVPFDKRGDVRVYARLVRPGVDDAELKQALAVKTDDDKVWYMIGNCNQRHQFWEVGGVTTPRFWCGRSLGVVRSCGVCTKYYCILKCKEIFGNLAGQM